MGRQEEKNPYYNARSHHFNMGSQVQVHHFIIKNHRFIMNFQFLFFFEVFFHRLKLLLWFCRKQKNHTLNFNQGYIPLII